MGGHLGQKSNPTAVWQSKLPSTLRTNDIMTLEAIALLECLRRFKNTLRGARLQCMVDNTVLEAALLSGSCRHRSTQSIIRAIFHFTLTHDISLAPRWIPSEENTLADALSRFAMTHPIITPVVRSLLDAQHPISPFPLSPENSPPIPLSHPPSQSRLPRPTLPTA